MHDRFWSRAQSKPETKMLGKETGAEAPLYGFGQHQKAKEKVPEVSCKAQRLRAREMRTGIQAAISHQCHL